jgi:hypothetical protein
LPFFIHKGKEKQYHVRETMKGETKKRKRKGRNNGCRGHNKTPSQTYTTLEKWQRKDDFKGVTKDHLLRPEEVAYAAQAQDTSHMLTRVLHASTHIYPLSLI